MASDNVKKFKSECRRVAMICKCLTYDCDETVKMLDGTSTIKSSLEDNVYMAARLIDIKNDIIRLLQLLPELQDSINGHKDAIIEEYVFR